MDTDNFNVQDIYKNNAEDVETRFELDRPMPKEKKSEGYQVNER